MCLGYASEDERRFVWQKDERRVFLALVDDLEHLNYQAHPDFFSTLTDQDVVITDNWFNRPLAARIIRLPDSWFGIYANQPYIAVPDGWVPTKSWCMPVNRIDYPRMMMLLEMHHKGWIDDDCLVHFNCARHTDKTDTNDQRDLWQANWQNLTEFYQRRYLASFESLTPLMPFRNHQLDLDSMLQQGKVHVVLETYVGDHSVALSEKIFRALCMPRPWRVLGGTWTVARLRALGFDVMDDIVQHETDGLKMIEDKISRFAASCHDSWTNITWTQAEDACIRARDHNQALLQIMRERWPSDLAKWLPMVMQELV